MLFDIPRGSGELVVVAIGAVEQKFAVEVSKRSRNFGGGLGGSFAQTRWQTLNFCVPLPRQAPPNCFSLQFFSATSAHLFSSTTTRSRHTTLSRHLHIRTANMIIYKVGGNHAYPRRNSCHTVLHVKDPRSQPTHRTSSPTTRSSQTPTASKKSTASYTKQTARTLASAVKASTLAQTRPQKKPMREPMIIKKLSSTSYTHSALRPCHSTRRRISDISRST